MYEKQMELFNDGGLKDEGGMIDEVSGNDVPVGSTREEVRDDIPAMLSEGEFVFPADVVRYLGLNRLMQLRQEAKMGLKQMEAMGQMGNSEEAIIPDDLPFDVLEIMVMEEDDDDDEPQEKYQGGVLHAARGTFVTPTFDPSNQDVRKYVNADGKTLMIPFLNGNPVYPVPAGYSPEGATAEEAPAEAPTQSSDDGPTSPPPQSEFQKAGGFGMDTSGTDGKALATWIKEAEKVTTSGNVVAGIIGAVNPLMGGLIALGLKKEKKTIEEMLDEKIAQAKKTSIPGQVKALEEVKKRLTTKEGKSIIGKVISAIADPILDAIGLGEEEKVKAKTVATTVAGQDTSESDAATTAAVEKVTAEAAIKMASDDAAMQQMLAAKDEDTEPVVSDSQLTDVGLDRFESDDARQTRAALGFSDPAVEPSDPDLELEAFTSADSAPAPMRTEMGTVMNAKEDLRQSMAGIAPDTITSAANAVRERTAAYLKGQGSLDTAENVEAAQNYLSMTMGDIDTISQGASNTAPAPAAPTPAEPVQGGGDDDDDGGVFAAPTSNVGNLQGMSTAEKTAAVAEKTDNLSPTARTGGVELDSALGISGLNRGGFAKRKKK